MRNENNINNEMVMMAAGGEQTRTLPGGGFHGVAHGNSHGAGQMHQLCGGTVRPDQQA